MKDRLMEIVKDSLIRHIDNIDNLAENIVNDLLANGVIVPHCTVGETVYQRVEFSECAKAEDCECVSCEGCTEEEEVIHTNICPIPVTEGTYYEINRLFGEVYFASKEQAMAHKTGPQYKFFEGELSK